MNVNKFIIAFAFFYSFNFFGQEKEVFFLLTKDNPKYIYFINGMKDHFPKVDEAEKFFITSTEEYSTFLKEKEKKLIGESYLPGHFFKVKSKQTMKVCDLKDLCLIDYEWLTENAQIKNKETIELNRFENLFIVLKEKEHCIIYDVVREFTSH